jgi:molybdate transport system regulatory protein
MRRKQIVIHKCEERETLPLKRATKKGIELDGALWFHKAEQKFLGSDRIALLEKVGELGSITKAAKAVGISYKNAWDIINMINNLADRPLVERLVGGKGGGGTNLTDYGREVIRQFSVVQEEHRKFLQNLEGRLGDTKGLYELIRRISMKVSARNILAGSVAKITKGAVNSEVELQIAGGAPVVAVVTNGAVENLALKEGVAAYAIIKASSILIGTDLHDARISARNIMCGTVAKIIEGPVSTEVDLEIAGGNTISAVITYGSGEKLDLKVGGHACAMFKASSVILGVS